MNKHTSIIIIIKKKNEQMELHVYTKMITSYMTIGAHLFENNLSAEENLAFQENFFGNNQETIANTY